MKIKIILVLSISILIMTNCKKENKETNASNSTTTLFSGIWTIDSTIIRYYQNDTIGPEIISVEYPAYFNFFSSNQTYYRNLDVLDTTNYFLVGSDTIIIDLNHDNLLDSVKILTLTPNHRFMFNWTTKDNFNYKTEEKIYLHK